MRNLFERLPYNSETACEINQTTSEEKLWDINTYMLTNVLDALMALDWHFIAANSKHPPKPPKPFDRPGKKETTKKKGFYPGRTIVVKE